MRRAVFPPTLLACSASPGVAAAQAPPENAVGAAERARIVIGLQRTDQAGEVARSIDARILGRLVALLRSDPRVRYAERDRRVGVPRPVRGRRSRRTGLSV